VQDAFCEHRPSPRKLFKPPPTWRDTTSWCDEPDRTTSRRRSRCKSCERAHTLYADACDGQWRAECALFRLARRGAVRLLAERRAYEHEASRLKALARESRRSAGSRIPPAILILLRAAPHRPPWVPHRIAAHREVERDLIGAHVGHLRRHLQRRRARLRDLRTPCDHATPALHHRRGVETTGAPPHAANDIATPAPTVRLPTGARPRRPENRRSAADDSRLVRAIHNVNPWRDGQRRGSSLRKRRYTHVYGLACL